MDKWQEQFCDNLNNLIISQDTSSFVRNDARSKKILLYYKMCFSLATKVCDKMLRCGDYKKAKTEQVIVENVDCDNFDKMQSNISKYKKNKLAKEITRTLRNLILVGNKYFIHSITAECVEILRLKAKSIDIPSLLNLCNCKCGGAKTLFMNIANVMQNKYIKLSNIHNGLYDLPPHVFYHYMIMTKESIGEPIRFHFIQMYFKMYCPCNVIINSTSLTQEPLDCFMLAMPNDNEVMQHNFWKIFAQSVFDLIDFKKFTLKEFYNGPGKSLHLTLELKFELLYQITKSLSA